MTKKEFTSREVMVLQEDLQKGIQVIGEQYNGIIKRFDGLDERFKKIDARLDRIDAHLFKIDLRLDKIDARLDKVEARLERMEQADPVDSGALKKRVIVLKKKFA